jgi:hypothetical protein
LAEFLRGLSDEAGDAASTLRHAAAAVEVHPS